MEKALILAALAASAVGLENGLGRVPQMGWNRVEASAGARLSHGDRHGPSQLDQILCLTADLSFTHSKLDVLLLEH